MSVPTIALYASPPGSLPSTSPDHDLNPRPISASSSAQRPIPGGLSCLFSSSPDDQFSSLLSYSTALKSRDQSPISVFHGPSSSNTSRSPPRGTRESLYRGFITKALGSCLDYDYDSPTFSVAGGGVGVDELSFGLEDDADVHARDLLSGAQSRHGIFYEEFVVKAFYEAEKAHRGQMRASGDPYLQHCVETAVLLARIGANTTVVAAGLLHDTLDDSFVNYDYIFQNFGAGVADLVEGVTKLSHLSKLARENNTAAKTIEADRLHTLFLAMADARAVLIKLADRLHNMMTLEALPVAKQQRFAKETLEIFAPLANRLGIYSWKEQLENLCFKHLHPQEHEELSTKLGKSFNDAETAAAIEKLEQALKKEGVSYHVLSGRHKSLYSIYSKMLRKKLSMDEIHDIHGIRLIVEDDEDCFRALEVVQRVWPEVTGRLKDYITHPKINGYRSLHTVVLSEDSVPLEVQIRTREMHLQAEFGFAAHWRYKEGDCKLSSFVLQMVEWARWVVTWQCETMKHDSDPIRPPCPFPSHSDDCPYSYTGQCGHDAPILIILLENEKMSVQEFPANSTVMDLLERVGRGSSRWSPYGFPMKEDLRPKLNHEPVCDPLQKLNMGDVVEMTPTIPDKSLTDYREEIQRMYNRGLTVPSRSGRRS